jgi:hypothetical protein
MAKLWLVTCDRCGAEAQPAASKVEVNDRARRDGWRLGVHGNGNVDLCPDCRAAQTKLSP